MTDELEDIDQEVEDPHMEEELAAAPSSDGSPAEEASIQSKINKPEVLKMSAALVVLLGIGAYFMMGRHTEPSPSTPVASSVPPAQDLSEHPMPIKKPEGAGSLSSALNGTAVPSSAMPAAIPVPSSAMPVPAAIPQAPAISSLPQAALASAVPAASAVVNEQPPSAALLTNTHDSSASAVKPDAPSPISSAPSSPFGLPVAIPAAVPAPVPATPAVPSAAVSTSAPAAPSALELAPSPIKKTAAVPDMTGNTSVQPESAKVLETKHGPEVKNGEPMPAVAVTPVDKVEMGKAAEKAKIPNVPAESAAMPVRAQDSAKVEELEQKITDLEKTISQLQQEAVVKETAQEKSVEAKPAEETNTEESAPTAAPPKKNHHRGTAHHNNKHAVAVKWVLKAAKPGVAWVAKKGSGDLLMVETGDSLPGVGNVTAIVKSSSGRWVVNGTKGRISQ